jgi:ABC-type Fe3+-siderophore transport system permease subunit
MDPDCTSTELDLQVVLAGAGLAATLVVWMFVKRRSYGLAGAAFVVALLLFAAWAVFLDAATHGWGNLKLLWLGAAGRFH